MILDPDPNLYFESGSNQNTGIRICNSATDCTADSHTMVPWSPKEGKSAKLYCTKYDEKIPIVHTKVPVLDGVTV